MSYTISIYVITMSTHIFNIFNIFNILMNFCKIEFLLSILVYQQNKYNNNDKSK